MYTVDDKLGGGVEWGMNRRRCRVKKLGLFNGSRQTAG